MEIIAGIMYKCSHWLEIRIHVFLTKMRRPIFIGEIVEIEKFYAELEQFFTFPVEKKKRKQKAHRDYLGACDARGVLDL